MFLESLKRQLESYWISFFDSRVKLNRRQLKRTIQRVFVACGLCLYDRRGRPVPFDIIKTEVNEVGDGFIFYLAIPIGFCPEDVIKEYNRISSALRCDLKISHKLNVLMLEVNPERVLPSVLPWRESEIIRATQGTWKVIVGIDERGHYVTHDFERNPHMLFGGATNMGKTATVQQMIITLLLNHSEEEMHLYLIDLKGRLSALKFTGLPHIPHGGIAGNLQEALDVLDRLKELHKEREKELASFNAENVQEYEEETGRKMPRIFVVVDEAAELAEGPKSEKDMREEVSHGLSVIARLGRATGFRLLYGTQRPDSKVVDGQVKNNLLATIALKTKNQTNSQILLDSPSAAYLPNIQGRLIYKIDEERILQAPYMDNQTAKQLLQRIKQTRRKSVNFNQKAEKINGPSDVLTDIVDLESWRHEKGSGIRAH